uniref:Uncharacterized protein n=1 Tax=Anguilla anguilla TaxID=7936 RepID=A0A0E9RJ58_ANGAN
MVCASRLLHVTWHGLLRLTNQQSNISCSFTVGSGKHF